MWWSLSWKSAGQPSQQAWPLSLPLLRLSEIDVWTLADAFEGVQILGATGSGKTTGSGQAIAGAFLRAGMGGVVLTAKSDERQLWERYCRRWGRSNDLMVFGPRERWRFNFLDYELRRPGDGAGLTENLVNLFSEVLQIAERQGNGGGGREDEGYWRRACRQMTRNLIDLLILAIGRVSIPELYRLVVSLPTSPNQVRSEAWRASSFCFQCLRAADHRPKSAIERRDFELVVDYAISEFPSLSEKTRSVIVSTFTSLIDVFQRNVLRELFCTDTNLTPDMVLAGKIILLDLPVKEYAEVGQIAQVAFKYCFMRSIERRPSEKSPRPVFLWADESQNFTSAYDFQFQATARSSRVCTVYLTQNLSNYYATLGAGEQGKAVADSLLANLNTKIFHANGDPVTNEWAANLIGRSRQFFINANSSQSSVDWLGALSGWGHNPQSSAGVSESFEYEVQPARFTLLGKGGPANDWQVGSLVFQGGRRFQASGKTWLPVTFSQRL